MLYAEDAGIVSKSAEGLAKMTVIANGFEAAGHTVSEKKTEKMLLRTPNQTPLTSPLVIKAAGQMTNRLRSFFTSAALSARPPTLCQRSNDGSDSHASIGSP